VREDWRWGGEARRGEARRGAARRRGEDPGSPGSSTAGDRSKTEERDEQRELKSRGGGGSANFRALPLHRGALASRDQPREEKGNAAASARRREGETHFGF